MFNNPMETKIPKDGDLQVWHIPQVPMEAFNIAVESLIEAKKIMDILAYYDLFQLEHGVKPDYANASGLNVFEEGEWITWYSENGFDIDEMEINKEGKLAEPY